jgi:hypothetical protein
MFSDFFSVQLDVKTTAKGGITITTTTKGSLMLTTSKKLVGANKNRKHPNTKKGILSLLYFN